MKGWTFTSALISNAYLRFLETVIGLEREQKCYRLTVAKREGELGRDGLEFGFQKQTITCAEFNKQQAPLYSTGNCIHTP